ncbi:MAG: radical SAM/Cys-rich domain protein [Betaproteobacteria bacterium]|nr:radical SAM/Cys-rich domain protein [Betaproteobacteria bacterium]
MHDTLPMLNSRGFPRLRRGALSTLQVNLGYRCNQTCVHCHVNAGPNRTEEMSAETVETVIEFARVRAIQSLDITGGAPELNPHFRHLVSEARALGVQVTDRCNLTILEEPGHEDLAQFLAGNSVQVTASLPCYLENNVDKQRGKGVFGKSIEGLHRLNALGYGKPGTGLQLNLVYNPQGPSLPPPQGSLEQDYRKHLGEHYGVQFNSLYTLTNMPIQRFGSTLVSKGQFDQYMNLLVHAFQPANLEGVMCRSLISVDWQGHVYDCDFNQMLGIPMHAGGRIRPRLSDLLKTDLEGNSIAVFDHCFGCTAGQGSSCGGALAA